MYVKKLVSLEQSKVTKGLLHDNPRVSLISSNPMELNFLLDYRENDPRPYLRIRIFGSQYKALLDSGASNTVMGKELMWIFDKFPAKLQRLPEQYILTADKKKHNVIGKVTLPLTLAHKTKYLSVLVVPSLNQGIILGIDFWNQMHLVMDAHNKSWEFSDGHKSVGQISSIGLMDETELMDSQKKALDDLLHKYLGDQPSSVIGRTHLVEHKIDTGNSAPIKQRYYPMSPARLKEVYEELDKMLEQGVVSPSKSAWSSPIILLDKSDGKKRFCVDFRKVNAVTKRDAYPLPHVTSILDRLRDARFLSTLDIKSAYWQVPLEESSKEKTAFTVQGRGLFHFNVLPFGLHNAPATWQRLIDTVLGMDLEPYVFVYLDDIIIVTQTFDKHLEILEEIFKRLSAANLSVNRDKCHFCKVELRYLGYVVDRKGLRVDPEKVSAVLEIPVPTSMKEVRQFCGTASWYRRFIPNFASRIHPLTTLLRKNQPFKWSEAAQAAFDDIRESLVQSPILSCPDFDKPFTISCDASGIGIGSVLSQNSDEGEKVIAYASRTLSKSEQKFSATERECLAVIWSIEKFRPYIEGTHFEVITDHHSLLWLHNLKDPQGRLARWALRLQPFDFTLIHRKGKEHVVPDLLSRNPTTSKPNEPTIESLTLNLPIRDKWYLRMTELVKEKPDHYSSWKVINDHLWKFFPSSTTIGDEKEDWKLVVPKDQRPDVFKECHDAPTSGHLGIYKTYHRLLQKYYWPKMRKDTANYVSHCKICQQAKSNTMKPAGLMGTQRVVDKPWQTISLDLMGPFVRSSRGFKYLLVIVDYFSKYTLLFPLRAATARLVSKHLEEDVFLVYGVPNHVICDNGSEFIGKPFKTLLQEYKVKTIYTPSHHPQANPTERVNRTIGSMLRSYIGDNHRQWDVNLPHIGCALRTAVHETTGHSPAFLIFGHEIQLSGEGSGDLRAEDIPQITDTSGHLQKLTRLKEIFDDIKERMKVAFKRNSYHYNLRRREQQFREGQKVWKRNFAQADAANFKSSKLFPKFVGPYIIKKKISPVTYLLQTEDGDPAGTWHTSDLKPYVE